MVVSQRLSLELVGKTFACLHALAIHARWLLAARVRVAIALYEQVIPATSGGSLVRFV